MGAEGIFKIELEILNKETLDNFEELGENFEEELEKTFKQLLLDVNKYLIRVTPIDTGELRGGWTAFLDSENEDYSRQIRDTSLAIKALGRKFNITQKGIAKGQSQSNFEFPTPLNWTIINNVEHGFLLEHGTSVMQGRHFVTLTRYKAEIRFDAVFREWFEQIAKEGKIVPFKSKSEDIDF